MTSRNTTAIAAIDSLRMPVGTLPHVRIRHQCTRQIEDTCKEPVREGQKGKQASNIVSVLLRTLSFLCNFLLIFFRCCLTLAVKHLDYVRDAACSCKTAAKNASCSDNSLPADERARRSCVKIAPRSSHFASVRRQTPSTQSSVRRDILIHIGDGHRAPPSHGLI